MCSQPFTDIHHFSQFIYKTPIFVNIGQGGRIPYSRSFSLIGINPINFLAISRSEQVAVTDDNVIHIYYKIKIYQDFNNGSKRTYFLSNTLCYQGYTTSQPLPRLGRENFQLKK